MNKIVYLGVGAAIAGAAVVIYDMLTSSSGGGPGGGGSLQYGGGNIPLMLEAAPTYTAPAPTYTAPQPPVISPTGFSALGTVSTAGAGTAQPTGIQLGTYTGTINGQPVPIIQTSYPYGFTGTTANVIANVNSQAGSGILYNPAKSTIEAASVPTNAIFSAAGYSSTGTGTYTQNMSPITSSSSSAIQNYSPAITSGQNYSPANTSGSGNAPSGSQTVSKKKNTKSIQIPIGKTITINIPSS